MPQHRHWRRGCRGSSHSQGQRPNKSNGQSNGQQLGRYQSPCHSDQDQRGHYQMVQQLYFRLAMLPNAEQLPRYFQQHGSIQDNVRKICLEIDEILTDLDNLGEYFGNQPCLIALILSKLPKLVCKSYTEDFEFMSTKQKAQNMMEAIKNFTSEDVDVADEFVSKRIKTTVPYYGHTKVHQCYSDVYYNFLNGRDHWFPFTYRSTRETQTEADMVISPAVINQTQTNIKPQQPSTPNGAVMSKPQQKLSIPNQKLIKPATQAESKKVLTRKPYPPKPCAFCNGLHFNAHCPTYTTPRKRRVALVQHKRCFKCFSNGHSIEECKKPNRVCHNCGVPGHHRLLCSLPNQKDNNKESRSHKISQQQIKYQQKINSLVQSMMSVIHASLNQQTIKKNIARRNLQKAPD